MAIQVTLIENEWKTLLCPFEKVKKFNTGISIKCPPSSEVWWSKADKDELVLRSLITKREGVCINCKKEIRTFLNLGKPIGGT